MRDEIIRHLVNMPLPRFIDEREWVRINPHWEWWYYTPTNECGDGFMYARDENMKEFSYEEVNEIIIECMRLRQL